MKQTENLKVKSQKFGKTYLLTQADKIGQGNFAEVYKIYDPILKKYFALRRIKKNESDVEDIAKQKSINQELKNINNPYILQIHQIIEFDKEIIYITEYCDGGSLWDALNQLPGGKFSEKEAVSTIIKICKGVQILHQNKITHRDLKPQNILLTKKFKKGREIPDVKIADFGLSTNKLIMQTVAGTKEYLSPQQAKFHSYTNSVDVWAIGIIFDQLLHGTPFYTGQDNKQVFNKISTIQYEVRDKKLIKQIQDLLNLMLKKRAYQRPIISHIILKLEQIEKSIVQMNKSKNIDKNQKENKSQIGINNAINSQLSEEDFTQLKIKKGLITSAWDMKIVRKDQQKVIIRSKIRKPLVLQLLKTNFVFILQPIMLKYICPKLNFEKIQKLNYLTDNYQEVHQWISQNRKVVSQQFQRIMINIKQEFYWQVNQSIEKYVNSIFHSQG